LNIFFVIFIKIDLKLIPAINILNFELIPAIQLYRISNSRAFCYNDLYMTIQEQIKDDMKHAMKEKNQNKLTVTRGLISAFTNELVASGKTPQTPIDDDAAMAVITRAAKQRKDSIAQFEKGGRTDLAEFEKAELEILESYLPELMSEDEIKIVVDEKIATLGVTDKSDMGKLIGSVMSDLKGKADGSLVKKVVENSL